jgi:hypothetical protein
VFWSRQSHEKGPPNVGGPWQETQTPTEEQKAGCYIVTPPSTLNAWPVM